MTEERPKVFISYSHDSEDHKERVLELSDQLCDDGIDCALDRYEISPPEGWPRWCYKQVEDCKFVLVICTKTYLERFNNVAPAGTGKGVKFEGYIITQELYDNDSQNTKFIPVVFSKGDTGFIPKPLKGSSFYILDNVDGYKDLYRHLTGQHAVPKPKIGEIRDLPLKERTKMFEDKSGSLSPSTTPRIFISKLPQTGTRLFGRNDELALLDRAWADNQRNIVCFSAMGGTGKTSLVKNWLNTLSHDNYREASHIYAWSFYSQGTREGAQASADEFFDHALRWFGYSGPLIKSEWEKGEVLSELIKKQRTLLIIDGLEPLQYPPGAMQGRLKDQGLQSLLRELAAQINGLCIITTRLSIVDIADFKAMVQDIPLEHLSDEAGAQLLVAMDVKGTDEELKQATAEFKGHALALTLLGSYLSAVHDGDIRKRDRIPKLTADEEKGGHAKRVMESYVKWLAGTPELNILFLMGLFDRPAPGGAVTALRAKPSINNLTGEIYKLRDDQWQFAVKHLRELRLLDDKDQRNPDTLDCHPFVREYFGDRLRHKHPIAWKKAHSRLYEYFKIQSSELPNTLEEMAPLFSAVAHGCAAGRHRETLVEVFTKRIRRLEEIFIVRKLGAMGSHLVCLSYFFETTWHTPVGNLTEEDRAFVLNEVGYNLSALGRLTEAAEPLKAAMDWAVEQKDWEHAAIAAANLSLAFLNTGEVNKAVECAKDSVEYADKSGDAFQRMGKRAGYASALQQAGYIDEAERLFMVAEEIQRKRQPEYPWLYSFQGFQYCDLLLERGNYQEVLERAGKTLKWVLESNLLLDIALDNLSLGRSYMLKALKQNSKDYSEAERHLNDAVDVLRKAGQQQELPRGLLARSELYRVKGSFIIARHDLDEAINIATRGSMRLHEANCHLEYARLNIAENNKETARRHYTKANKMINEMGYHRRDKDLKELEELLK